MTSFSEHKTVRYKSVLTINLNYYIYLDLNFIVLCFLCEILCKIYIHYIDLFITIRTCDCCRSPDSNHKECLEEVWPCHTSPPAQETQIYRLWLVKSSLGT